MGKPESLDQLQTVGDKILSKEEIVFLREQKDLVRGSNINEGLCKDIIQANKKQFEKDATLQTLVNYIMTHSGVLKLLLEKTVGANNGRAAEYAENITQGERFTGSFQ